MNPMDIHQELHRLANKALLSNRTYTLLEADEITKLTSRLNSLLSNVEDNPLLFRLRCSPTDIDFRLMDILNVTPERVFCTTIKEIPEFEILFGSDGQFYIQVEPGTGPLIDRHLLSFTKAGGDLLIKYDPTWISHLSNYTFMAE